MIEQQPQSNKQNNLEHPKLHITNFDSFQIREAELQDTGRIYNAIDEHRNYLRTWLPFVDHLQCIADEEKFISSTLSVPYKERNSFDTYILLNIFSFPTLNKMQAL